MTHACDAGVGFLAINACEVLSDAITRGGKGKIIGKNKRDKSNVSLKRYCAWFAIVSSTASVVKV